MESHVAKARAEAKVMGASVVTSVTEGSKSAISTVSAVLSELAERSGLRAARLADSAIASCKPLEINEWSELSTATKLIRTIAGLDRPESTINVAILGAWGAEGRTH